MQTANPHIAGAVLKGAVAQSAEIADFLDTCDTAPRYDATT